jgi:hypothetical protein
MARICFGEFDWPDERGKRRFAQLIFLQAVSKFEQAPLEQLYNKPFKIYLSALNDFHLDHADIARPWRLSGPARSFVEPLEAEIEAWVRSWNLSAKWCIRAAFATLQFWSCSSREITELSFSLPSGGGGVPTPPDPPKGFPNYPPYVMSQDYYLEMVRDRTLAAIRDNSLLRHGSRLQTKAFVESIVDKAKRYCRTVEEVYVESEWKRCRKSEKKNLKQHLEWTVKFQVGGKTFSELAEAAHVEQTTVSRAVRDILSILPLTQRPDSKPGRIRGRKNKRSVEAAIRRDLERKL